MRRHLSKNFYRQKYSPVLVDCSLRNHSPSREYLLPASKGQQTLGLKEIITQTHFLSPSYTYLDRKDIARLIFFIVFLTRR